jgi:hypothetical protein
MRQPLTPAIIADMAPGAARGDTQVAGLRAREYTAADLVEDYIKEALSKQKRGAESARLLRRDFVPLFGSKPARELTRRELQDELIRPTLLRHPRKATQLLSRIR